MQTTNQRPCILCIGGLDPSGGAGLQADIEAIAQCGGYALPIASCLTVQDSSNAKSVHSVDSMIIKQQANALFDDMKISACKIGVIPNQEIAITIAQIIKQLPNTPIVLDPVISASHGAKFVDAATLELIKDILLPTVTVATPNTSELNQLITEGECITSKAKSLCILGPQYVLVTGADEETETVVNFLVNSKKVLNEYSWPRQPYSYHGSGCTLSSALACNLAFGLTVNDAVEKAQRYTIKTLEYADMPGQGQWIPKRILK